MNSYKSDKANINSFSPNNKLNLTKNKELFDAIKKSTNQMKKVSNKIDGAISSMNEAVSAIKDVSVKLDGAVTEMKEAVTEMKDAVREKKGAVTEMKGEVTAMNDSVGTMKNISLSIDALTNAIQNLISKKFS